jgi:hypothetical protein
MNLSQKIRKCMGEEGINEGRKINGMQEERENYKERKRYIERNRKKSRQREKRRKKGKNPQE